MGSRFRGGGAAGPEGGTLDAQDAQRCTVQTCAPQASILGELEKPKKHIEFEELEELKELEELQVHLELQKPSQVALERHGF